MLYLLLLGLGLSTLFALAWFNPRRRSASHQPHVRELTNWQRWSLNTMVWLPLLYALWQQHWTNMLITMGLILLVGWSVSLKLAVQR